MATRRIGIIVNGATGRMGYRQHLVRSLLAIQEQGGVELASGDRLLPDLLLVGRNEEKLRGVAEKHGLTKWTTDVDEALANPDYEVYFDALVTNLRVENLKKAIAAGKAIYTEKPTAESFEDA
ncbi:MAG: Gfo/Idh/MocA family oxidoreductase, partial [Brachybacterium sp.]